MTEQINGRPTLTHAPNTGSPAIDAGNPTLPGSGGKACAATDQRGYARLNRCDMGAYEVDASAPTGTLPVVLSYTYDHLYRLTNALMSNGNAFTYTYDAVGNRKTESTLTQTTVYTYDNANRLTNVGAQAYTWDNNGNLLNDGARTYAYDTANRPITITQGGTTYTYKYNGMGDRRVQAVNSTPTTYTVDINAGLTQVLADGTNTYLYGNGRIAEYAGITPKYYLGDGLGSVRQLTNNMGSVTLGKMYQPYGSVMSSAGSGGSMYGFTGEQTDSTGLVFLRARYYSSTQGRLIQHDAWPGDYNRPQTRNGWGYVEGNPINRFDPSGHCGAMGDPDSYERECWQTLREIQRDFPYIDLQTELNRSAGDIWKISELELIRSDLEALDAAAQVDFLQIFGMQGVRIRRVIGPGPCGETGVSAPISLYDTTFSDPSCIVGTVGHELVHQWDYKSVFALSTAFERFVGAFTILGLFYNPGPERPPLYGTGSPPNRREDFAESLTEYVYDDPFEGIIPSEKRWVFVETLLATGGLSGAPVPVPEPPTPIPPLCTPMPLP